MKTAFTARATIFAALITLPLFVSGQNSRTGRSASVQIDGDQPIANCGDIRISYDRQPALKDEVEMTVPASQISTLRARMSNAGLYVSGWDRSEYSVRTCKAAPSDDPDAAGKLREIQTNFSNGELTVSGPAGGNWTANLIIMVPRLSAMELETSNGPMQLRNLAGNIRLNASNGPISLNNVGGYVQASTSNGPISEKGASGDHRLTASNGPINVGLSGSSWDGPGLEASTQNGPLSVSIPSAYGSGVTIQTSDHSPVSCSVPACAGVTQTLTSPRTIRLGNGDPVVRLSTRNGPLSIQPAKD